MTPSKRIFITLGSLLLLFALCIPDAMAEPLGFRRPRSTFSLGIEAFDHLLGDFGKASDVGMSVFAETTIQFGGYFAANVRFGSARAFTNKDFLPFDNGYQYIYLTAGPRFYLAPFRKLNLFFYAQPEIALQILVSNTLVTITGNDSTTGAAGGSIGAQYLLGILSISGQVTCQYNWVFQALFIGGSISVGLSNVIQ